MNLTNETLAQQWYSQWFNTPYYHALYKDRNQSEAEGFITTLLGYIKLPLSAHILDLACGKGRHAIAMSKLGFEVTGLDLSSANIQAAKQHAHNRLHFEIGDMRYVLKPAHFDAVFNLFTSFGYFDHDDDNLQVIKAAAAMLRPKGIFVLDFLNAHKTIKQLVEKEHIHKAGIDFEIIRKVEDHTIVKHILFKDQGNQFHFTERVKAYGIQDIEGFISKAGLQIKQLFGNYQLEPFELETADRLIVIAQKTEI